MILPRRRDIILLLLLLMLNAFAWANSGVWDAAADFSISNGNPNGAFAYGYLLSLPPPPTGSNTSRVALMDVPRTVAGVGLQWLVSTDLTSQTPHVTLMTTAGAGALQGQLVMHPGCEHAEIAVVAWTAPQRGEYVLDATFGTGDVGTASVSVYVGNVTLMAIEVVVDQPVTYFGVVRVLAGATVYFCVGLDKSCGAATTPVDLVVTRVARGWDATADFSGTLNPYGAFSYGYYDAVPTTTALHLFDVHAALVDVWRSSVSFTLGTPSLSRDNGTNVPRVGNLYVGQLIAHAGCAHKEVVAVQWRAPFAGVYTVRSWFGRGDTATVVGSLYVNGVKLLNATLVDAQDVTFPVYVMSLHANDNVSQCVSVFGGCTSGSTPIMLVVTTAAVFTPTQKGRRPSTRTSSWTTRRRTQKVQGTYSRSLVSSTSATLTDHATRTPPPRRRMVTHSTTTDVTSTVTLAAFAPNTLAPTAATSPPGSTPTPSYNLGLNPTVVTAVTVTAYGSAAIASSLSPTVANKPGVTSRMIASLGCQSLNANNQGNQPPTPATYALVPGPSMLTAAGSSAFTTMSIALLVLLLNAALRWVAG